MLISTNCHRNIKIFFTGFLFSGTIKTALPGMDREVKEHYQVVIQAKDMAGQMGGLSGTTTVSITLTDVNDSPPRFANRKTLTYEYIATDLAELQTAKNLPGVSACPNFL